MKLASVTTSIALVFLLVVPVALTGCMSKSEPSAVETGIATVASGGVGTYESYASKAPVAHVGGPVSAMRLTRWQLRNMIGQASSGMGMTGAALDAFNRTPSSPKTPGFSAFLGAWLKRARGPLATYAASFMPKSVDYKHPAQITFPVLAVTLIIADAARPVHAAAVPEPQTSFEWQRMFASPASAAVGCSTVTDFISSVVADVTSALQVSGDGFFATLWNTVVAIAVDAAVGALKVALAPIFAAIKTVASVLAMVTVIASSLQPWTVSIASEPESVKLLGTPVYGRWVATLTSGDVPWPDELKDCAKSLAGVDLDTISSKDAPVEWETSGQIPEKATYINKSTTLLDDKTAIYAYRTVPLDDAQKEECSTLQQEGTIGIRATIERADVQRLQAALTNASLNALPNAIKKFIEPLIRPWIESMMHSFANMLAAPVSASATTPLMQYEKDPAKCTPAPGAPTPAASAPVSQSTPGDKRIAGNWACVISKHIVSSGIAVDIDTHVEYDLAPNGVAVIKFPNGASGTFGAGGGNVQANKDMTAQAPGTYTYTGTAAGGTLHMSNGSATGDEVIKFANANAFSTTLTSPQNNESFPMKCARM